MEILSELVKFLNKNKSKNIQIIGQVAHLDSNITKLYDLLTKQDKISDEDIACNIYGQVNYKSSAATRKLKSRLTSRLLNTILLSDPDVKNHQIIDRAFLKANKLYAVANIFLTKDFVHGSKLCYEQVLTLANYYEFVELKLLAAARLRQICAEMMQNRNDYLKYNSIYQQTFKEFEAEKYVTEKYSDLISLLSRSRKLILPLAASEIIEIKTKLEDIKLWCKTLTFEKTYFLFMILINFLSKQYTGVIQMSDQAIDHFTRRNYSLRNTILMFKNTKIMALLESGQYNAGIQLATSIKEEYTYGEYNWHSNQYYLFLLLIYSGEYSKAATELSETLSAMNTKTLPTHLTENMNILTANIYFLNLIGKINSTALHNQIVNFKINRFLNQIPTFSKDKRGLNISILILHVLIMLANHEYSKIIDRVDALNQYDSRYLRKDATFRSSVMVKMLLAMVNADFHLVRTIRHTEELFKKLHIVPRGVTEQGAEVEVIPYEDLWPMVLELLKRK